MLSLKFLSCSVFYSLQYRTLSDVLYDPWMQEDTNLPTAPVRARPWAVDFLDCPQFGRLNDISIQVGLGFPGSQKWTITGRCASVLTEGGPPKHNRDYTTGECLRCGGKVLENFPVPGESCKRAN